MLSSPHPHPSVHLSHRHHLRHPASAVVLYVSTTASRRQLAITSSHSHNDRETLKNPENTTTATAPDSDSRIQNQIFRKHNDKSRVALLRHLSESQPPNSDVPEEGCSMSEEDKVQLLEMSLVRKRTPQFPGSIFVQSPSDVDVNSSLPPLQRLVAGDDDEVMLLKALEIRRSVTVEIFKEAMRRGKFGITYYTNLASRLPEFIDFVMIKAASMKQLPEFSKSSFNVRAKAVIDDSNVVSLIRWLKHNSLSYPQIGKLICMSRGNLDSIRHVAEWLKSVRVNGRFIGVALMKAGEDILDRNTEELDEIVGYLEKNGVRRDWMGYVISRCPQLLSYSMEEVKTRVQFYLDMGMNDKDFGTMVFDFPKVLGYLSMEEMKQKVVVQFFHPSY